MGEKFQMDMKSTKIFRNVPSYRKYGLTMTVLASWVLPDLAPQLVNPHRVRAQDHMLVCYIEDTGITASMLQ